MLYSLISTTQIFFTRSDGSKGNIYLGGTNKKALIKAYLSYDEKNRQSQNIISRRLKNRVAVEQNVASCRVFMLVYFLRTL